MSATGKRVENAGLAVGDGIVVAVRSDVSKGKPLNRCKQIAGRIDELGGGSSVVARLESGWCVNIGDIVVDHQRTDTTPAEGDTHG